MLETNHKSAYYIQLKPPAMPVVFHMRGITLKSKQHGADLTKNGTYSERDGAIRELTANSDEHGTFVEVDTDQDVFEGATGQAALNIAKKYIYDHFKNQYIGEGPAHAHVTKRTADEYSHPVAKNNMSNELKTVKAKLAPELEKLLTASVFESHESDDGRHSEAVNDWDHYTSRFHIGGKWFSARANILLGNGYQRLYDVTRIREIAENENGTKNAGRVSGLSDDNRNAASIPASSYYHNRDESVNTIFSLPTSIDSDFASFLEAQGINADAIRGLSSQQDMIYNRICFFRDMQSWMDISSTDTQSGL